MLHCLSQIWRAADLLAQHLSRCVYGLLLLLCGCASLSQVAPQVRPEPNAQFALNGRISVEHQGVRQSAGLRWTHSAKADEMLLLAPLGLTAARVYRDDLQATLQQGDQHYAAADAETLMQQVLGWYLPMNGLHHWVLGLAERTTPAQIERDERGQIAVLRQDGWEIRYLRYAGSAADSLPTRMQLSGGGLQMLLLIDEWEIP